MCNCIKSILKCGIQLIITITNFLVLMTGISMVAAGSVFLYKAKTYDPSGEEGVTVETSVIIALGVITALGALLTIIGFCGCCGALCSSPFMLKTYAVIQLFIFLAVLGGLIFVLIWDDKFTDEWYRQVQEEYSKPDETSGLVTALTLSWDARMKQFQCCGSDSYTDWRNSYFEQNNNDSYAVPETCCKLDASGNYTDVVQCQVEARRPDLDEASARYLNTEGCDYLVDKFRLVVIAVSSCLLVFQLASMILACIIVKSKSKTDTA